MSAPNLTSKIKMCTLGMFIIDEIEDLESKAKLENVIGGAGTYAAVGARLAAGHDRADSVGWILDIGSDFPPGIRTAIEAWGTSCHVRKDESRLTTRAWNGYGPGDHRGKFLIAFKYLTPKLRIDHTSLPEQFLQAESFHLICSGERCQSLVSGILERLSGGEYQGKSLVGRPSFIWEPVPDVCVPSEVRNFKKAIREVDIVSPNLEEFLAMFPNRSKLDAAVDVMSWGIGPTKQGALVIREGKDGCSAFLGKQSIHLRAFHSANGPEVSKVVDPTGGGNAFAGALAMALQCQDLLQQLTSRWAGSPKEIGNFTAGLAYATIAASFVIEQVGTPVYEGKGIWNGENFAKRVAEYVEREHSYLVKQLLGH